ncbi:MAG: FAD-dependent oxidoreductase [Burkholderiales bacterium]|nr:FAD-dependent oxidoreductase [Burkholderiales bacterium]
MNIIVVGAGVTGVACTHSLLRRGHNVTLIESASAPNQGCSYGMSGFMGPNSLAMLCAPFKGKAGLASVFAKTIRLGWDVSLNQMKFLRLLAAARSADKWKSDFDSLHELARYSVGVTEYVARLLDIPYEQIYGLMRVFTNQNSWEEAHKDDLQFEGGEWLKANESLTIDEALKNVPGMLGSYFTPRDVAGNGTFFSKQVQAHNVTERNLTMLYHTTVQALQRNKDGKVTGVKTDKGEVPGDVVILSNNTGAKPLLEGLMDLPIQTITGWTLTMNTIPTDAIPTHTLLFENKDVLVTRLGNRLRISGRYWLGSLVDDVAQKTVEGLYENASKLLPQSAQWKDHEDWMGQTLAHPDSLPSCGKTNIEGLMLNICHGLNGWALSNGCAEMLADLIEDKKPIIDPAPYSPLRFSTKQ